MPNDLPPLPAAAMLDGLFARAGWAAPVEPLWLATDEERPAQVSLVLDETASSADLLGAVVDGRAVPADELTNLADEGELQELLDRAWEAFTNGAPDARFWSRGAFADVREGC
jgi:hypothetical protein